MFTKSRIIGVLSVMFFTLAGAWASPVEGVVKDAQGKPLAGAEIRIQTQNGKLVGKTNTDAHGHYVSANLPAGTYKVDCLVNSVLKASIKNVTATTAKSTQLSFALTGKTIAKTKHRVWVPARTGTNIGGSWVDVNDDGTVDSNDRVQSIDAKALQRASGGNSGGLQGLGNPGFSGGSP